MGFKAHTDLNPAKYLEEEPPRSSCSYSIPPTLHVRLKSFASANSEKEKLLVAFFLQDSLRSTEKLCLYQEGKMFIALKLTFIKDHFIKLTANRKKDHNSCCGIRYCPDIETRH